jgi:hypothetical protein
MTLRTSHASEKVNHALAKWIAAANRGWMSEKNPSPGRSREVFLLDIPFL